ncbi:metallophosphoesterase [Alkalitalea saponilacus]|uniref:Calcineurin-like phosphoesterase n=2 Tax=Alkalitalea saponilacus TaxID=889453 RepID=A0A1T5HP35_9BACT|nr:metallophosphoesterase [Alkalitalea saponilacus]SKC22321.1 Calcineurin-like phosphoesterase [Alkalitalea saponilacus]
MNLNSFVMRLFKNKVHFSAVLLFLIGGCNEIIEYSPYKAGVKSPDEDLNIKAMEQISEFSQSEFRPFKLGLVGDSHTYYDYYEKQIRQLNKHDDIDFVVHLGDITLSGIYREFIWFRDITAKLNHPMITIIGNHDYLSNGEYMYQEMFGPLNFTMVYNDCLLVFFDNVIWEKNVEDPDFDWLESVLEEGQDYRYRFVFSHIPPWSDQFNTGNEYYFNMLMDKYNVDLSIHGHTHNYRYKQPYDTGPPYLVVSSSQKGEIFFLHVEEDGFYPGREDY